MIGDVMAFQSVPNVVHAQFIHSFRGEPMINDIDFWRPDGDITTLTVEFLANGLRTAWSTNMMALMSDDVLFQRVVCTDLTLADGPVSEASAGSAPGTGGNAEPNNVCIAIKKTTGARGKSQRGRIFWGGVPTTGVDENNLTTEYAGDLLTAFNGIFSGVDSPVENWNPVVVSRFHLGAARPVGVFLQIQRWDLVDTVVDSYRTRLPGHRRRKKRTIIV